MKTLKWFQVGDSIPNEAKFIKSETRLMTREAEWHGNLDTHEEFYLYEVPLVPTVDLGKEEG